MVIRHSGKPIIHSSTPAITSWCDFTLSYYVHWGWYIFFVWLYCSFFGYFSWRRLLLVITSVCDYLSKCFEKSACLELHEVSYVSVSIVASMFLPVMAYKFPFQTEAQYQPRAGSVWFEGQGSSQTQSPVLVASLSSFLWSTTGWTVHGNHRAVKIIEDIISYIKSHHFNRQPHN